MLYTSSTLKRSLDLSKNEGLYDVSMPARCFSVDSIIQIGRAQTCMTIKLNFSYGATEVLITTAQDTNLTNVHTGKKGQTCNHKTC